MQISRPEASLKRDSDTCIFLWIFCNFSKHLIYRTPPDDCSCWFLHSNQSFINWSHFVCFDLHFFLLFLIIAIMGVYSESLKMKIFLLFTLNIDLFYFWVWLYPSKMEGANKLTKQSIRNSKLKILKILSMILKKILEVSYLAILVILIYTFITLIYKT